MNKKIFYLSSTIVSVLIVALLVYAYGGTDPTVHGHSEGEVEVDCSSIGASPTDFVSIESQGQQLGCMQNNTQGTDDCRDAFQDCWSTYGGRLPSYGEAYIAFNNYVLTNEGNEWVDGAIHDSGQLECSWIDNSPFVPGSQTHTNNVNYRCFIPR